MNKRIALVAGGTGGHIFPAIAFGDWLKNTYPNYSVRYVSGNRELERKIYASAKISPYEMRLSGSPASTGGHRIRRSWELLASLWQISVEWRLQQISACVVFGSYVSLPPLLACKLLKIPVVVHEQNAVAGRVTLLASKLGIPICSGWSECSPLSVEKFTYTGFPTRRVNFYNRGEALKRLKIPEDMPKGKIVVVLAGSMGSKTLTDRISRTLAKEASEDFTFIFVGASEKVEMQRPWIKIPPIWDVGLLYSIADLLVVRGGGSTLAEIKYLGIPSLIIPWGNATGNHQKKNATQMRENSVFSVWEETMNDDELSGKFDQLMFRASKPLSKGWETMYNESDCACSKLLSTVSAAV